jgi:photosystem II stability/assembly factor-like uncharacterized protein
VKGAVGSVSLIRSALLTFTTLALFPGWISATTVIPTPHRTLIFVNQHRGFVIGDGSFYRSDDGGATWKCLTDRVPGHGRFSPRDGFFLNDRQGWLVSNDRILATEDGGTNWKDVSPLHRSSNKPGCFDDHFRVRFLTPLIGWVVGKGALESSCEGISYVLRTQDGGHTWHRTIFRGIGEPRDFLFDFAFKDHRNGCAIGYWGIYTTEDGGDSWLLRSEVPDGSRRTFDWPSMQMVDSDFGSIAANGKVKFTRDGGRTWLLDRALSRLGYVRTVLFLDRKKGLVSGDEFLLRTTDAGKSLRQVGKGDFLIRMSFVNPRTGWAMISDLKSSFRVMKTDDGGASWVIVCAGQE